MHRVRLMRGKKDKFMKKIIVADDEELIRRLVSDFLTAEGYEPLQADDGDVALKLFEENPDTALLILDIMMPDDYVTKPCSPSVLMKRVAALLRRRDGNRNNAKVLSLGDLKLDSFAHEVWLGGKSISLTLKEYSILQKLLAAPGRVFTREQMLDDIWGFDFDGDIRTIDSHVARLRTKLGEWGSQHIKTIYGTGYKLEVSKDGAQKDENA